MHRPSLAASFLLLAASLPAGTTGAQAGTPAVAPPSAATCIASARKLTNNSNISRNDDHEVQWRASGCEVRLRFRGDLRFTDDFRSIAGLGGGSFRATEDGPVDRELEIRAGDAGALRYTFRVDGRERPFEGEGQAWLESVLLQLFRRSGYAADARVQWLLRRGGADAVFAELALMEGDYARHEYSVALLRHSSADAAMQTRVLESAAAWSSDYYKSELLDALTTRSPDARVAQAGWNVARSLDSDYYATKGIQRLLDLGAPSAAETEIALAALEGIESDYYRSELLKSISRRTPLEGRVVPLYLRAAERTSSDHYRAEMLAALVGRAPLAAEHLVAAIRTSATMRSEHYRTQALVRIARAHELTGDALAAYMAAAEGIGSSHYRREAEQAVRRGPRGEGGTR
jgi:hypothetical protein